MTKHTRFDAARDAFRQLIHDEVKGTTPGNDLVSHDEARDLGGVSRRAERSVRGTKPKYGRVRVEEVVTRAVDDGVDVWESVQPPASVSSRDRLFLSVDEIAEIGKTDPELAALSMEALLMARSGGPSKKTDAIKEFLSSGSAAGGLFSGETGFGTTIDVRPGRPARADVPANVLESFDHYFLAEQADWATATLKRVRFAGQELLTVHLGTDGDPGYLELFSTAGEPMVSARFSGGDFDRFDPFFGLGRTVGSLGRLGYEETEGFSEEPEKIANGQITNAWVPDVVISEATIHNDNVSVVSFDTATPLSTPQRELAHAALDLAYERVLSNRQEAPGEPVPLRGNGALRLGTHTNSVTGESYIVADYRDVDDASHTFHFQRAPSGVLRLMVDQVNG